MVITNFAISLGIVLILALSLSTVVGTHRVDSARQIRV